MKERGKLINCTLPSKCLVVQSQGLWYTPIIPALWKEEAAGLSKAAQGKKCKTYLKN
jgi:hypothetical protein